MEPMGHSTFVVADNLQGAGKRFWEVQRHRARGGLGYGQYLVLPS